MYLLILGGGILTGFINTLSGNGSVILATAADFCGIAVDLNETIMRRVIGVVIVIMLILILTRPQCWLHGGTQSLQGIPAELKHKGGREKLPPMQEGRNNKFIVWRTSNERSSISGTR